MIPPTGKLDFSDGGDGDGDGRDGDGGRDGGDGGTDGGPTVTPTLAHVYAHQVEIK